MNNSTILNKNGKKTKAIIFGLIGLVAVGGYYKLDLNSSSTPVSHAKKLLKLISLKK